MGKAHKGNIHCSCLAFDLFCLSTQNDVIGAEGFCNEKAKRRDKKLDRIFFFELYNGLQKHKGFVVFQSPVSFLSDYFLSSVAKVKAPIIIRCRKTT